jgi:hypothetical protein
VSCDGYCDAVVQKEEVVTAVKWVASVARVLNAGDDVEALRDVMGRHGRIRDDDTSP